MKPYAFPTHLIYDGMGAPPIDAAPLVIESVRWDAEPE